MRNWRSKFWEPKTKALIMTEYHKPVLLKASIEGLKINPDGIYVDVTFGGGGHSAAILEQLNKGRLIAFDKDSDAVSRDIKDDRFTLINHDFIYLKNFLKYLKIDYVSGILADLGVSSHQFDTAERGFSYRFDSLLDMRMDQESVISAVDLINNSSVSELSFYLRTFGEIKRSNQIARSIEQKRKTKKITNTSELAEIAGYFAKGHENIVKLTALLFQSFRIAVNNEIQHLRMLLKTSSELLEIGGRLVVISYHSLEDRLVKNFIKSGNFDGTIEGDLYGGITNSFFKPVTKKAIVPDSEEISLNSRARSAKLRVGEKIR